MTDKKIITVIIMTVISNNEFACQSCFILSLIAQQEETDESMVTSWVSTLVSL